jgi:signal transduction histidine kinase
MGMGDAVAEREAAWELDCFARERAMFRTITAFASVIILSWSGVDFALAPDLAPRFLAYRLVDAAVGLALLVAMSRARDVRSLRTRMIMRILAIGVLDAILTAQVDRGSYVVYMLGSSLLFWGCVALTWTPREQALATVPALALTFVLSMREGRLASANEIGAMFYLASTVAIGSILTLVRARLQRQAFEASYALAATNRDLQAALARLKDAQARLVNAEKQSAIGRLLSGLSHEINNPVNVLHNNLAPLSEHVADLLAAVEAAGSAAPADLDTQFVREDARDALGSMATAVQRIRDLHRELRLFVRGDAPSSIVGDLNVGVTTTVQMMKRSVPSHVRVELDLAELPHFAFQPGPVNQVILNLLLNAIDAVGDNGTVTVRTRALDAAVELSITDDGPGVSPTARAHLFEPFFTTKDVGHGTGLGLATSYQIITAHAGTIAHDAEHAPGARFVITLPVS